MPITKVQHSYVMQTETHIETKRTQSPPLPQQTFELVDEQKFLSLFKEKYPQLLSDVYIQNIWDRMVGNVPHDTLKYYMSGEAEYEKRRTGKTKEISYITNHSATVILEYFYLFLNGIDSQNLPAGFYFCKQQNNGIRDVLDYNPLLKELQADIERPLAINLDAKKTASEIIQNYKKKRKFEQLSVYGKSQIIDSISLVNQIQRWNSACFYEPEVSNEDLWFNFLNSRRNYLNDEFCTEQELRTAFDSFCEFIQQRGLSLPRRLFEAIDRPVNPIILLSRWKQILSNPALKRSDLEKQWDVITRLPVTQIHTGIRPISDYRHSQNPCCFLVPEMEPEKLFSPSVGVNITQYLGVCSIGLYRNISSERDFWRYIAYQSPQNSIEFYEKALDKIKSMDIEKPRMNLMYQMLADSTSGFNHLTRPDETLQLSIWNEVCELIDGIEELTSVTRMAKGHIDLKGDFLQHFTRLKRQPNILFLRCMSTHIKNFISNLKMYHIVTSGGNPSRELNQLSDDVDALVREHGINIYTGARHYFVNQQLTGIAIDEFVNLQKQLHKQRVNGKNNLYWLIPHLSTFSIKTSSDITDIVNALEQTVGIDTALAKLVSEMFFSIKQQVQPGILIQFISALKNVSNKKIIPSTSVQLLRELQKLEYQGLEQMLFNKSNYFYEKEIELYEKSYGLVENQKKLLNQYEFSNQEKAQIYCIESALLIGIGEGRSNRGKLTETKILEQTNEILSKIKDFLSTDDFKSFLERLKGIRLHFTDGQDFIDLLRTVYEQQTLANINAILITVANQQSKGRDFQLLKKINAFLNHSSFLVDAEKSGTTADEEKYWQCDLAEIQQLMAQLYLKTQSKDFETAPSCAAASSSSSSAASSSYVEANAESKAKKSIVKAIETILHGFNAFIKDYPHVKGHLIIMHQQLERYNDNNGGYQKMTSDLLEILGRLRTLLPPEKPENMTLMHALIRHYTRNSYSLHRVLYKLEKFDDSDQVFFLHLINNMMISSLKMDNLTQLIDSCVSDRAFFQNIKKNLQSAPYPDIDTLLEWKKIDDFGDRYHQFAKNPFAPERRLQYAFNFQKFQQQRGRFPDEQIRPLFTDELGAKLNELLTAHRNKTMLELREALHETEASTDNDAMVKKLCLCVEFLARTCHQHDKDSGKASQELNTTQIMSIYAMLSIDKEKIMNQIDTGEGKSRIMVILAAMKTLEGKTVDFITSDMTLAERDYYDYRPFFNALGIQTSMVDLSTPKQLYQNSGKNFSDDKQLILQRNRSHIEGNQFDYLAEDKADRFLLIDEADHLIHSKCADAFNYARRAPHLSRFIWIYPYLLDFTETLTADEKALLFSKDEGSEQNDHLENRFIEYVKTQIQLNDETQIKSLVSLFKTKPKKITVWLKSAIKAHRMEKDVDYATTADTLGECQQVKDHEGYIQPSRIILPLDHGRPVPNSSFSDGVSQCLAVLENRKDTTFPFIILPENETLRSSYIQSFLDQYPSMIGLSGTHRVLPNDNDEINMYGYHYMVTPRENPLIREDKNCWVAKDKAQQREFIIYEIKKALAEDKPVLIVCRDDKESEELQLHIQADLEIMDALQPSIQRVHSRCNSDEEKQAVKNAGHAKTITLSTTGMFSRGKNINADNLEVILTHIASREDEIQTKGRAGRFGKPGGFRSILDLSAEEGEDLTVSYNFANEVYEKQQQMTLKSSINEDIARMYDHFNEAVHRAFVEHLHSKASSDKNGLLSQWTEYLDDIQKDWDGIREQLIEKVTNENGDEFKSQFGSFATKWMNELNQRFQTTVQYDDERAKKTYQCLLAQKGFFTPQRQPIIRAKEYHPSHEGQAVIYSSLFARERAVFRGEAPFWADYKAWNEGRGELFPDMMATLRGERPLFANLRASIARLIEFLKEWFAADPNDNEPAVGIQTVHA